VGVDSGLDFEWKCRWKTLKRGELDWGGAGCGEDSIADDLGEDDEACSDVAMSEMSRAATRIIRKAAEGLCKKFCRREAGHASILGKFLFDVSK
jgi:hypothetical protein